MSKSKLAIIIPAYKVNFISKTLESIAHQTNKNFVVYVGNDGSSHEIEDICNEYKNRVNLVYHYFPKNLGEKSLVTQWKRCIALSKNEPWIWLFSDDDIMDKDCVEKFYEALDINITCQLFRFNKEIFFGNSTTQRYNFEDRITIFNAFTREVLIDNGSKVTMPEFIFSRNIYAKLGLVELPLAWGSDKATWLNYTYHLGFLCNVTATIFFNNSGENISSDNSTQTIKTKTTAKIRYIYWLSDFFCTARKKFIKEDFHSIKEGFIDRQALFTKLYMPPLIYRAKIAFALIPWVKGKTSLKNIIKVLFPSHQ